MDLMDWQLEAVQQVLESYGEFSKNQAWKDRKFNLLEEAVDAGKKALKYLLLILWLGIWQLRMPLPLGEQEGVWFEIPPHPLLIVFISSGRIAGNATPRLPSVNTRGHFF